LAALRGIARLGQIAGHLIEGFHQKAQLVAAGSGQLFVELAGGDRLGAISQFSQRPHQPARGIERGPERRQHRQQQHQRQGQGEAGLERRPQKDQFLVAVERRLHRVGQQAQAIGDRKQCLQLPFLVGESGYWHHRADVKAGVANRLQADVIAALPDLQQDRIGRRVRQNSRRVHRRGGDDAAALTEQGQFGGFADVQQFV
jgi:hypothetical protein